MKAHRLLFSAPLFACVVFGVQASPGCDPCITKEVIKANATIEAALKSLNSAINQTEQSTDKLSDVVEKSANKLVNTLNANSNSLKQLIESEAAKTSLNLYQAQASATQNSQSFLEQYKQITNSIDKVSHALAVEMEMGAQSQPLSLLSAVARSEPLIEATQQREKLKAEYLQKFKEWQNLDLSKMIGSTQAKAASEYYSKQFQSLSFKLADTLINNEDTVTLLSSLQYFITPQPTPLVHDFKSPDLTISQVLKREKDYILFVTQLDLILDRMPLIETASWKTNDQFLSSENGKTSFAELRESESTRKLFNRNWLSNINKKGSAHALREMVYQEITIATILSKILEAEERDLLLQGLSEE